MGCTRDRGTRRVRMFARVRSWPLSPTSTNMPPQRRQSFAPTSSAGANRQGIGRKRAASFVPGEAARQLAPRKSILKSTPFTFSAEPNAEDAEDGAQPQTRNPFSRAGSEMGLENTTVEYRAEVSDNTSRKSLGLSRRVSFAPLAQYRYVVTFSNSCRTRFYCVL